MALMTFLITYVCSISSKDILCTNIIMYYVLCINIKKSPCIKANLFHSLSIGQPPGRS